MENVPFIDDFPIKTSIYKGFSMAMLNNQMVYIYIPQTSRNQSYWNYLHQLSLAIERGHLADMFIHVQPFSRSPLGIVAVSPCLVTVPTAPVESLHVLPSGNQTWLDGCSIVMISGGFFLPQSHGKNKNGVCSVQSLSDCHNYRCISQKTLEFTK